MTAVKQLERLIKVVQLKGDVDRNVAKTEAHAAEVAGQLKDTTMQYAKLLITPASGSLCNVDEMLKALNAVDARAHEVAAHEEVTKRNAAKAREMQASVAALQVQAVVALAKSWMEAAAASR